MYEWIDEVNELLKGLKQKENNRETRTDITKETIKILRKHNVTAIVNCSPNVNTAEVIQHGDFNMTIETKYVSYLFRYQPKELSA